jgi:hypothetical protein
MSQLPRRCVIIMALTACGAVYVDAARSSGPQPPPAPPAQAAPSPRAVVDRYCVTCHNARLKRGDLVLEGLDIEHVGSNAATWEKVVKKVQAGVMPPAGSPRPAPEVYHGFLTTLERSLDEAAGAAPNPGRPAVHRLNRAEYTNAVRDLLALDIDGKALLPADNSGYGFDNVADVLTVSPGLLERYILAAKKISRLATGDPRVGTAVATYDIPYMTLRQDDRVSEDLPFGSRGVSVRHYFPTDGDYEIKIRLQRNSLNIGNEIRGLEVQNQIDLRLDGVRLKVFTIGGRKYSPGTYTATEDVADSDLKLRFPAKAGARTIAIALNKDDWYVEGVGMSRLPPASDGYASGRKTEPSYGRIDLGIDRIDVTGPFDATVPTERASRRRVFVCHPAKKGDEDACARTILSGVARRAYRRPLTPADVDALLAFYKEGRGAGTFDDGIEKGLVRILTDPEFLFRVERDPAGRTGSAPYRISDGELASRLSFFLWSSIPDDQLLDAAARGTLRDPAVFEQQVRRMLADDRAHALLNNFFGQWLLVRNMATVRPDPKAFPDFDENLRLAFEQETELFLASQLRDDRPIADILTANYTFVNERLAQHYGIANVYGTHFRRVTLPEGERAGLLGQGSLLTVTSYADRTSVVLRGKFILESILGTPPPPPPPVVPPLENTKVEGSLRQRMEQHRSNPVCANCHAQIDPLGFALENFDGIGKWRTTDGKVAIDASGALPDGTTFNGPAAFRQALMQHHDAFMSTLTEKLLTYALGRGIEPYDMPTVRAIIRSTEAGGNNWSALILNVTRSLPFQMRRTES